MTRRPQAYRPSPWEPWIEAARMFLWAVPVSLACYGLLLALLLLGTPR